MTILWVTCASFAVLSAVLLSGRGSFLIAGYNTASREEKAKYDEKKLCRVMGVGTILITLLFAIFAITGPELLEKYPWILAVGIIVIVIGMLIASNTMCKNKNVPKTIDTKPLTEDEKKKKRIIAIVSTIFFILIFIFVGSTLFAGSVDIELKQDKIVVDVSGWSGNSVALSDIKSVEYREGIDLGIRTNGLGNFKINAGNFKNDEFGKYYLYSYADCKEYVVIKTDYGTFVLNSKGCESTKRLYLEIKDSIQ